LAKRKRLFPKAIIIRNTPANPTPYNHRRKPPSATSSRTLEPKPLSSNNTPKHRPPLMSY
jgi:hypothetical protein